VFTAGAPDYTITIGDDPEIGDDLLFWGEGVRNDSRLEQTISAPFLSGIGFFGNSAAGDNVVYPEASSIAFGNQASAGSASFQTDRVFFENKSTAGDATIVTGPTSGPSSEFRGNSSAGNARITLLGGNKEPGSGVNIYLSEDTTPDQGTFIAEPATVAGKSGATIDVITFDHPLSGGTFIANGSAFGDPLSGTAAGMILMESDAGTGTYIINGATAPDGVGGEMQIIGSAGAAFITVNGGANGGQGGSVTLALSSTDSTARIAVHGNGFLNPNVLDPGATIGSLEGDGLVLLGKRTLIIGSNNLSTTFNGDIQGTGAITKIGTGTLTLAGASSYRGGTTIAGGILLASNTTGSGTGVGAVGVNAGTLGGSGIIAGAVTVGTNSGAGAFLAPSKGVKKPATLTIQGALTLNDDSTYLYKLDTKRVRADEVIANKVVIDSGAKFSLRPSGNNALTVGQVFTVISNTGLSPIAGTFHNLRDGAIITVNGSNFQASYTGGDGNDLTLTVVP
jgi:autotransporter-associated beta strand protein